MLGALEIGADRRALAGARSGFVSWAPIAAVVLYAAALHLGEVSFDDSYFFKRFALNFLEHGVFAWNVADGPLHGSTSQLFQLVATVAAALTPDHFIAAVKVINALCLLGFGWALLRECLRSTTDRVGAALWALSTVSAPVMLSTLTTGMETALTLLLLCLGLSSMIRTLEAPAAPTAPAEIVAALTTALVYSCRPDAALILGAVFVTGSLLERRVPWRYLVTLAGVMALLLLSFRAYYGTALPLPFHLKAGLPPRLGWGVKREHFSAFVAFAAPLAWLAWRRRDAVTVALGVAALAFVVYHLTLTDEVMGYRGRFYVPALVPLNIAAARAWDTYRATARALPTALFLVLWAALVAVAYHLRVLPTAEADPVVEAIALPPYLAAIALGAVLLFASRRPRPSRWRALAALLPVAGLVAWLPPQAPRLLDDEQMAHRYAARVITLRGIFDVERCIPGGAKNVYHSEMGVTGLVLMRSRVTDLIGLLSAEVLIEQKPFQELCTRDQPEAIFLPHRNYVERIAEILASPCIQNYERVVSQSSTPLYIRKDLLEPFLSCATEVHQWR